MSKVTPIAAYANDLVAAGVPLPSIVNMIESHYIASTKRLEEELRDSMLSSLRCESLQAQLAKAEATIAELRSKIAVSVDRSTALQSAVTAPINNPQRVAPRPLSDDELIEAAAAQQQHGGRRQIDIANDEIRQLQGTVVSLRLFSEQLQKQYDVASSELAKKTAALESVTNIKRRLELENHQLNMHSMGLHDEISKVMMALESTRDRLKSQVSRFDDDRQTLISTIADLRSNLDNTTQRGQSEVQALTNHVRELERQLSRLKKSYAELKDDYLAATRHNANAEGTGVPAPRAAAAGITELSPAAISDSAFSSSTQGSPTALIARQHTSAMENLVGALEEVTHRATTAEAEVKSLRQQLESSREKILMLTLSPAHAGTVSAAPSNALVPREAAVATPPPPPFASKTPQAVTGPKHTLRGGVDVPMDGPMWQSAVTPEPNVARRATSISSTADGAGADTVTPQRAARREQGHGGRTGASRLYDSTTTGWSPNADPQSLRRLTRAAPSVVTLGAALDFVGGLTAVKVPTVARAAPHRVQPLTPE